LQNKSPLLIALFGVCIGLAACGRTAFTKEIAKEDPPVAAHLPGVTMTFTPFQATSPTPRPTHTLTPTPIPSPTRPACLTESGRIEEKEEVVRQGRPPFEFRVYFPPCFDENKTIRYPVLYMIHGQTFQDDQWERLGIGAASDALIKEKKAPPFLIVMPLERDTFEDIYLAGFNRDVVEGLVPWIDATYPTCAERACRAVGGLSRGGAWSVHLGLSHWELFSAIGMHSTPPFNGDTNQLPTWLHSIPEGQLPRIWMDAGRQDVWLKYTVNFETRLVQLNVPHEWHLYEGQHEEPYWSTHVKEYVEWYSQPWKDLPAKFLSR
jgi:enterochelin esterase-like enzyme